MLVSDVILAPLQPSQFDVWTLSPMETMVRKAKILNPGLRAFIVLNRASANPAVCEVAEAREIIGDLQNLVLARGTIRDRIAFRKAARDGLGVTEMQPSDPKAVAEIKVVYQEVYHA